MIQILAVSIPAIWAQLGVFALGFFSKDTMALFPKYCEQGAPNYVRAFNPMVEGSNPSRPTIFSMVPSG